MVGNEIQAQKGVTVGLFKCSFRLSKSRTCEWQLLLRFDTEIWARLGERNSSSVLQCAALVPSATRLPYWTGLREGKKWKERNRRGVHKTKRMEMKQHGPCLIAPDITRPVERRENLYGRSYQTAVCNYVEKKNSVEGVYVFVTSRI